MLIGLETSKTVATIQEFHFGANVSVANTWHPVYAFSKKQNMVCLSSGESELMPLVGGACECIATRDQWNKLCKCSPGTIVHGQLSGFVKRNGVSRRTRPCGHESLLYASLGDGTWTTYLEGTCE